MRWTVAVVLVAALGTGSAGAAQHARQVTFFNATAHADFWYTIDYGSHPDATFNGEYTAHLRYSIRTIVSFDGRRIKTVDRVLVDATSVVANEMTVWKDGERTRVSCNAPSEHDTRGARQSSGAQISVGGGVAHLDPGSAARWPVGCAATESLAFHGLPDGKTISGGASVQAFRAGFACSDEYEHDADRDDPNGHSFAGTALFFVKFSPIARDGLPAARRAVGRQVGRDIPWRRPAAYRDCLDAG
jgi:hypothetical protein